MSIPEIIIVSIVGILGLSAFAISIYMWIDFELSNKKDMLIQTLLYDQTEERRLYDETKNLKKEDDIDIIWSK